MIDFLGQEVKVGDYVTFNLSGKALTFGLVEKITPKQVKIIYQVRLSPGQLDTVHKAHDAVVKATCATPQFQAAKNKLARAIIIKVAKDLS